MEEKPQLPNLVTSIAHGPCLRCGCGFESDESFVLNLIADCGSLLLRLLDKQKNLRIARAALGDQYGVDLVLNGLYDAVVEAMEALERRVRLIEKRAPYSLSDRKAEIRRVWNRSKRTAFDEFPELVPRTNLESQHFQ